MVALLLCFNLQKLLLPHNEGLVGLSCPVSSLGKDSEAIINIYVYIYLAACPGVRRHANSPEQIWGQYSINSTWSHLARIVLDSQNISMRTYLFPKFPRSNTTAHLQATASHCLAWKSWLLFTLLSSLCKNSKNPQGLFCCRSHGVKAEQSREHFGPYFKLNATNRVWVKNKIAIGFLTKKFHFPSTDRQGKFISNHRTPSCLFQICL